MTKLYASSRSFEHLFVLLQLFLGQRREVSTAHRKALSLEVFDLLLQLAQCLGCVSFVRRVAPGTTLLPSLT